MFGRCASLEREAYQMKVDGVRIVELYEFVGVIVAGAVRIRQHFSDLRSCEADVRSWQHGSSCSRGVTGQTDNGGRWLLTFREQIAGTRRRRSSARTGLNSLQAALICRVRPHCLPRATTDCRNRLLTQPGQGSTARNNHRSAGR